jgi:hypothetical protein
MFVDADFNADVMRRIPHGYLRSLEEVAAAVGFLASGPAVVRLHEPCGGSPVWIGSEAVTHFSASTRRPDARRRNVGESAVSELDL